MGKCYTALGKGGSLFFMHENTKKRLFGFYKFAIFLSIIFMFLAIFAIIYEKSIIRTIRCLLASIISFSFSQISYNFVKNYKNLKNKLWFIIAILCLILTIILIIIEREIFS